MLRIENNALSPPLHELRLPQELLVEVLEILVRGLPPSEVVTELKNLALVCQSWLHLVRSTPSMWSRLYLHHKDIPDGEESERCNYLKTFLENWMKRAGDMPLEMEAHFGKHDRHGAHESNLLAAIVRKTASKWKVLKLHGFHPLELSMDTQTSIQNSADFVPVNWQRLESVELAAYFSDDTPPPTHIPPTPFMPRMKSLSLNSGFYRIQQLLIVFPFQQLRRITLSEIWIGHFSIILKESRPSLEECTISKPSLFTLREQQPTGDQNSQLMVLPNLRRLSLQGFQQIHGWNAFRSFIFPGLRELTVELVKDDETLALRKGRGPNSLPPLQELLQRSPCDNLTRLTLFSAIHRQTAIAAFPVAFPTLCHLDLAHAFRQLDFLEKWNEEHSLPALETFRLEILAGMWLQGYTAALNVQDRIKGWEEQLRQHQEDFDKFAQRRGNGGKEDLVFGTSYWSVRLAEANLVFSVEAR
jgi:F-box-like